MKFKWTEDLIAKMKRLTREGKDENAIAKKIGCTSVTVRHMQYRLGLKSGRQIRVFTDTEKELVRILYPDHTAKDIAQILKCTRWQLYNLAETMNLCKSKDFIAKHGGLLPTVINLSDERPAAATDK